MNLSDSPLGRRPKRRCGMPLPRPAGSPTLPSCPYPTCRSHYPGAPQPTDGWGLLRLRIGLRHFSGGSACATSLPGPARDSRVLRPVGLQTRPKSGLHPQVLQPMALPTRAAWVATEVNRQFLGRNLHPLDNCAFRGTLRNAGYAWLIFISRSHSAQVSFQLQRSSPFQPWPQPC